MEHVGGGIKRMKDAIRNYGLDEPEFAECGEFFKVTFSADVTNIRLNSRQKEFLRFDDKPEITIKDYMALFGIVRNTATKDLNELVDKDILGKTRIGKQIIYKRD